MFGNVTVPHARPALPRALRGECSWALRVKKKKKWALRMKKKWALRVKKKRALRVKRAPLARQAGSWRWSSTYVPPV